MNEATALIHHGSARFDLSIAEEGQNTLAIYRAGRDREPALLVI